jgi:ADP-ribose pyrophosphatase YjhB (NUDIX family)
VSNRGADFPAAKPQNLEQQKRTLVCENSQFHIFFDELVCEGRIRVRDYLVVAPKRVTADLVTGVAILPIYDNKIGLIQVYRHPIKGYSWEIPKGFVDEKETATAAAIRELTEETGLGCNPDGVQPLALMAPDAGILAARVQLFVALNCFNARAYAPTELGHQELRFFESTEVEAMISRGEVQDPSTIIAFFMYIRS